MSSTFTINIAMSGGTVATLQEYGFQLYGFRVIQGSPAAMPVVWFATTTYELNTAITWTDEYQAYTSRSEVIPRGQINASAAYPIQLGQVLQVTNPMGIGEVSGQGGSPSAIGIVNLTSARLTCGVSLGGPEGSPVPICALPLLGNNMDEVVPVDKVFLMFSSVPLNTGTVLEQAYGPGILIDLTGVSSRSVAYDADAGWSWGDQAAWAASYPPNQNLVPLLVQPLA